MPVEPDAPNDETPRRRAAGRPTNRNAIPPETIAEAVRAITLGESARSVAARLHVSRTQVGQWYRKYGARLGAKHQEDLGGLVFATVVETLKSITARAKATAKPDWIRAQSADGLARLDTAQWSQLARVLAAFRSEPSGGAEGSIPALGPGAAGVGSEAAGSGSGRGATDAAVARAYRNGAVDPSA